MTRLMRFIRHLRQFICTLLMLLGDSGRYLMYRWRAPEALAAENLFLRKQRPSTKSVQSGLDGPPLPRGSAWS